MTLTPKKYGSNIKYKKQVICEVEILDKLTNNLKKY